MPLQATSGAASYDAFGGGVAAVPNYIEDVFSTWLYSGTNATQTITNGIDLAGKGGLMLIKGRSGTNSTFGTRAIDTVRGSAELVTSSTERSESYPGAYTFNSNGFTLPGGGYNGVNGSSTEYVSWTFREQPKFFDVVTYTGNGSNPRNIDHALGSTPGCIIVKETNASSNWAVWHRSLGDGARAFLNLTNASNTAFGVDWFGTSNSTITSTAFSVGSNLNTSGRTYVAYLFAHNAGGFGLTGTDNVISCGSFTTNGSGAATVDLGYEPQWILCKPTSSTGDWFIADNMRGFSLTSTATLYPNSSSAENGLITFSEAFPFSPTATGFTTPNALLPSRTYIYIAIRRGPMRTPTTGTSVFSPNTATYSANQVVTTGFPVDMLMMKGRTITLGNLVYDRLRGLASTNTSPVDPQLFTSDTSAETSGDYVNTVNNTGYQISPGFSGFSSVNWNFRRAPGFFDEVCWTGDGATSRNITHGLTVTPQLVIAKPRSGVGSWKVYDTPSGGSITLLNSSNGFDLAALSGGYVSSTSATLISINAYSGSVSAVNASGTTYVAYLFATCPGVSKVGSYTGTGTTQTINCGFTGGARFVLIKRTDSTGDWYVWDTARGIVAGNDPYLLLNSTAAEVTNTDFIDTASTGFEISSTAPAAINASGGTYIFLAIA